MPNFFSFSVRCRVLAIEPSNRSQKPEIIRQTIAIEVRPYMASPDSRNRAHDAEIRQ